MSSMAVEAYGDGAARSSRPTSEVDMRGIIVFVIILLAGGGLFWALVGGCVAS